MAKRAAHSFVREAYALVFCVALDALVDPLAIKGTLRKYLLSIKHYIYIIQGNRSLLLMILVIFAIPKLFPNYLEDSCDPVDGNRTRHVTGETSELQGRGSQGRVTYTSLVMAPEFLYYEHVLISSQPLLCHLSSSDSSIVGASIFNIDPEKKLVAELHIRGTLLHLLKC